MFGMIMGYFLYESYENLRGFGCWRLVMDMLKKFNFLIKLKKMASGGV